MSIENAILELAAAIRHLADSNREIAATGGAPLTIHGGGSIDYRDEVEKAVTQVETDAKAAQQKAMDKVSTGKQEIADALAKAKAEKAAAAAPAPEPEDDPLADSSPVELDYEKDVKPLLVKVGKDKTQLVALLEKFGAKKGDQIAKADYPAVVAAANAIIGG